MADTREDLIRQRFVTAHELLVDLGTLLIRFNYNALNTFFDKHLERIARARNDVVDACVAIEYFLDGTVSLRPMCTHTLGMLDHVLNYKQHYGTGNRFGIPLDYQDGRAETVETIIDLCRNATMAMAVVLRFWLLSLKAMLNTETDLSDLGFHQNVADILEPHTNPGTHGTDAERRTNCSYPNENIWHAYELYRDRFTIAHNAFRAWNTANTAAPPDPAAITAAEAVYVRAMIDLGREPTAPPTAPVAIANHNYTPHEFGIQYALYCRAVMYHHAFGDFVVPAAAGAAPAFSPAGFASPTILLHMRDEVQTQYTMLYDNTNKRDMIWQTMNQTDEFAADFETHNAGMHVIDQENDNIRIKPQQVVNVLRRQRPAATHTTYKWLFDTCCERYTIQEMVGINYELMQVSGADHRINQIMSTFTRSAFAPNAIDRNIKPLAVPDPQTKAISCVSMLPQELVQWDRDIDRLLTQAAAANVSKWAIPTNGYVYRPNNVNGNGSRPTIQHNVLWFDVNHWYTGCNAIELRCRRDLTFVLNVLPFLTAMFNKFDAVRNDKRALSDFAKRVPMSAPKTMFLHPHSWAHDYLVEDSGNAGPPLPGAAAGAAPPNLGNHQNWEIVDQKLTYPGRNVQVQADLTPPAYHRPNARIQGY